MKEPKEFILKSTKNHDTAFSILYDTNLMRILNELLKHFRYETHFTSNAKTKKQLCERARVSVSMYHKTLQTLVKKKILIEDAKSYYILNFNLIEARDGEVKK
jgi:DNA-binding IclR family transcriptional regulator